MHEGCDAEVRWDPVPVSSTPSGTPHPPLVIGSAMRCPKCERVENILAYRPMRTPEKYSEELNTIVKCPNCGWLFSPGVSIDMLHDAFRALAREFGFDASEPQETPDSASNVTPIRKAE